MIIAPHSNIPSTPFSIGNQAQQEGDFLRAIEYYLIALKTASPVMGKQIMGNLKKAANSLRKCLAPNALPKVAVCGWEMAHNAAGRVHTLAKLYQEFAEVEIIGSIFPAWGSALWQPIRDTALEKHLFVVEDEHLFLEQGLQLVCQHPYAIVHLSKPRISNIFIGILYKLIWNSKILIDIDDEELSFVEAQTAQTISEYLSRCAKLPAFQDLAGQDWTRIAVGLVNEFDGITLSNPALGQRYRGEIIRHARDERLFQISNELKRQHRKKYGIPVGKKVVLFFGTPREHKGLLELAGALALMQRSDVIFAIVGQFPDPQLKARLLQITAVNYHFLDNQPIERAPELTSLADVVVLLQDLNSPAAQFQIPAKLSDAMALGIPILCTATAPMEEVIAAGAALAVDSTNLVAHLNLVLDDVDLINKLQNASYRFFQNQFSFKVNGRRLKNIAFSATTQATLSPALTELMRLSTLEPPLNLLLHLIAEAPAIATFSAPAVQLADNSIALADPPGSAEIARPALPIPLAQVQVATPTRPVLPTAAPNYMGYFDTLDETTINGWALNKSTPGKAIKLTIWLDGLPLMEVTTSIRRNDLIAKGIDGTAAGFSIALVPGLFRGKSIMDIQFGDSGISLSKSPKKIPLAAATPGNPGYPGFKYSGYLDAFRADLIRETVVIVPIFNAFEAVTDCIAALMQHLPTRTRVLLLDDASPDPRISTLLNAYASHSLVRVQRNPENMGYTRSVNHGISLCPGFDIVLLNSDTVVTPRWLESMRYCAYASARVATVTALSDNAGAFSVPEIGSYCPPPQHLSAQEHARTVIHAGSGEMLELPTGNGFCMLLRADAIAAIGLFDEKKFPRGYGEENDFCLRALHAGWKNLACDKAFVFHKRSQSFQGEKTQLMADGTRQLLSDYPEYKQLTPRFREIDMAVLRHRIRFDLLQGNHANTLPRILFVISTQTGGTPQTNLDLMQAIQNRYQGFLLRCDAKNVYLSKLNGNGMEQIESFSLTRKIDPLTHRSDEYDQLVQQILYRHAISLLHIRHIAWHSLGLADAAHALGIPVIFSLHDFYTVCPSLNLMDGNLQYCASTCTQGKTECQPSLWPQSSLPPLKHQFVHRWRTMMAAPFAKCQAFITTSNAVADIFQKVYPQFHPQLKVIPHGRDFHQRPVIGRKPAPGERVKVLVPGNITANKGALLIKQMVQLDLQQRFEFHFLGDTTPEIADIGIHHGKYSRADFAAKVTQINPHVGVVFSLFSETYCHTLSELWSCGMPVFGIDIGSVGERIRATGAGWLLPITVAPAQALAFMNQQIDTDFDLRLHAARQWQNTKGIWNNTATMAQAYCDVYDKLLGSPPKKRIGLIIKGSNSHPATAHIRVLRPFASEAMARHFSHQTISASWLLAGGFKLLDGVLIQRDACPPNQVDAVISLLKEKNIPFVYEIDDLLWKLPAHHTDHSITPDDEAAMIKLARNAALVTTSTAELAHELAAFSRTIQIIPNALDERIWLPPLSQTLLAEVGKTIPFPKGQPCLLYMGTKSHAHDLNEVTQAIELVQKVMPELQILQIGGGQALPGASMLEAPDSHTQYPAFVNWFRAVCSFATIAIAPLSANEFNHAKSDIKALDYGLATIPAIFSAIHPYTNTIKHMETGILCDNSTAAWSGAIMQLLKDKTLRKTLADAAFDYARQRGLQHSVSLNWKDCLQQAFPSTNYQTH